MKLMKTTLMLFIGILSLSAFSSEKSGKKTYDMSKYSKHQSLIIISNKRFETREKAEKYCKKEEATLASLDIAFGSVIAGIIPEADTMEAMSFNYTDLMKKMYPDLEMSGLMIWTDDRTIKKYKTSSGKASEVIAMFDGRGSDSETFAIEELNLFLEELSGPPQTLPAICEKPKK